MISCPIRMELESRSFHFFLKPPTRGEVCLTKRRTMDPTLRRRTDQSQFVKRGKHSFRIDAQILCHEIVSLRKIWWMSCVYLLDILSISAGNVMLNETLTAFHQT